MNLWSRIELLIRSMFRRSFERSEDTFQGLTKAYQQQQQILRETRQGLIDIATASTQLERKSHILRARIPQLETQAMRALAVGQENQARIALQRQQAALAELALLDQHLHDMSEEEQKLTGIALDLAARASQFALQRDAIMARYKAAQTRVEMGKALGQLSREVTDLGVALNRAEETTRQMEDRAAAIDSLIGTSTLRRPGDSSTIEHELREIAIDDRLDQLKEELAAKSEANETNRRIN